MRILLEAPIFTQSGYGEHSRLVYRSIKDLPDAEIYINPLNWGRTSWSLSEGTEKEEIRRCVIDYKMLIEHAKKVESEPGFDLQIHVGLPNEFEKKAPRSICVTAGIETDRVSPAWLIKTHQGINKLIVPSSHAKSGFENTTYQMENTETGSKTIINCNCPVEVVPYPIKNVENTEIDLNIQTKFNFLSVALLGPRKNLENMIKWFVKEFENDDVGLIIKTGRSTGSIIDRDYTQKEIKKILGNKHRKCKVYLLHGDLTEEQIHSLYAREDIHAYVSATHGEGYGLPAFEAAYSGLPIVITDWSGHLDFLSGPFSEKGKIPKNKKLFARVDNDLKEIPKSVVWKDILVEGSRWAFPKEASFKKQIRNVYKNHGMYKKWAAALKESLKDRFDNESVIESMRTSILGAKMEEVYPNEQNFSWKKDTSEIEEL